MHFARESSLAVVVGYTGTIKLSRDVIPPSVRRAGVVKMLGWKLHCTLNPTLCAAAICCFYIFLCVCVYLCVHFDSNFCSFQHIFSQPVWTNVWNLLALLYNLICAILCLSYFAVTNEHLLVGNRETFYIMPLQGMSISNHCYILVKVMVLCICIIFYTAMTGLWQVCCI